MHGQTTLKPAFFGVKKTGNENDHLFPSNVGVKKTWSYTSTPPNIFMVQFLEQGRNCGRVKPSGNNVSN